MPQRDVEPSDIGFGDGVCPGCLVNINSHVGNGKPPISQRKFDWRVGRFFSELAWSIYGLAPYDGSRVGMGRIGNLAPNKDLCSQCANGATAACYESCNQDKWTPWVSVPDALEGGADLLAEVYWDGGEPGTMVVVFRGTINDTFMGNWLVNLNQQQIPFRHFTRNGGEAPPGPPVHRGFSQAADRFIAAGLQRFVDEVVLTGGHRLYIVGHSLGGALAQMFAAKIAARKPEMVGTNLLGVITYGQPRVASPAFASYYNDTLKLRGHTIRYILGMDVVTQVPFLSPSDARAKTGMLADLTPSNIENGLNFAGAVAYSVAPFLTYGFSVLARAGWQQLVNTNPSYTNLGESVWIIRSPSMHSDINGGCHNWMFDWVGWGGNQTGSGAIDAKINQKWKEFVSSPGNLIAGDTGVARAMVNSIVNIHSDYPLVIDFMRKTGKLNGTQIPTVSPSHQIPVFPNDRVRVDGSGTYRWRAPNGNNPCSG